MTLFKHFRCDESYLSKDLCVANIRGGGQRTKSVLTLSQDISPEPSSDYDSLSSTLKFRWTSCCILLIAFTGRQGRISAFPHKSGFHPAHDMNLCDYLTFMSYLSFFFCHLSGVPLRFKSFYGQNTYHLSSNLNNIAKAKDFNT